MAVIPRPASDAGPILAAAAHHERHAWRAAPPQVTVADRAGAVEERVRQVRAQLLATLLAASAPCESAVATARAVGPSPVARPRPVVDDRPTANHPWRKRLLPPRLATTMPANP